MPTIGGERESGFALERPKEGDTSCQVSNSTPAIFPKQNHSFHAPKAGGLTRNKGMPLSGLQRPPPPRAAVRPRLAQPAFPSPQGSSTLCAPDAPSAIVGVARASSQTHAACLAPFGRENPGRQPIVGDFSPCRRPLHASLVAPTSRGCGDPLWAAGIRAGPIIMASASARRSFFYGGASFLTNQYSQTEIPADPGAL
jgi:hypothetical protein